MKSLAEQMSIYHQYHTKTITKMTHFIGVPLVILSIMILLNWVNIGINGWFFISVSWLAILALFIYYCFLDLQLALATAATLIVLELIAKFLAKTSPNWNSFGIFVGLFIIAWAIQFLGHFEGKRPALFDNLFQLFVAPIFLVAEIGFMLGKKLKLKQEVETLANQSNNKTST